MAAPSKGRPGSFAAARRAPAADVASDVGHDAGDGVMLADAGCSDILHHASMTHVTERYAALLQHVRKRMLGVHSQMYTKEAG